MGKMSMTNYLLQSALLGLLFTGYGLGLINRVAPHWLLALVLAIYLLQLGLSILWLRSHQYGPFEWLLRAVTILAWPAWRKPR